MTMNEWVNKYLGKGVDYDGAYGVQCVDLVKSFVKNVLGVKPQSIGNAIEYYNKRNSSSYLTKNFNWIGYKKGFVPQKGDICVFKTKSGLGHVSVASGQGNSSCFYSYDENYPTGNHEPMTLTKHNYNSLLGVLRPKNQSNIKAKSNKPDVKAGKIYTFTTNPYCYKDTTKKKKYTISELSGFYGSESARLKRGTKAKPITVETVNGNIWITFMYNQKKIYSLVYNIKKDKAYIE